jgi:predicted transcriptional regulator
MTAEPGLFSKRDREAEAAPIARARADIAAGRVVDHAEVAEWLKTWGTEQERPMPREWLE